MNKSEKSPADRITAACNTRYGEGFTVTPEQSGIAELARIAEHRSLRRYRPDRVSPDLLRLLCACALSAPTKSDLQQADIIHVADAAKRRRIVAHLPEMPWILDAPLFLVFCGNNRRIRHIGEWRGKPFANEHLDHFMNAAVDAGIVMMNFISAAEAAGLGTCPISAIRNAIDTVGRELELPEGVFPVAGLCMGYPAASRCIPTATTKPGCANTWMPTTSGVMPTTRTASSGVSSSSALQNFTAGRKTRPGNTPSRSARISAPTSGARASA